ncbi:hypothetical protein VTO42DRAFT_9042 [Malbranchea cinnamomea]
MFIVKGKNHQASWYQTEGLPDGGAIGISENGWTNKELGVFWLKEIFNRHTLSRTIGQYRLLILDEHSHSGPEFDQFCMETPIIPLYMPPHFLSSFTATRCELSLPLEASIWTAGSDGFLAHKMKPYLSQLSLVSMMMAAEISLPNIEDHA